MGLFLGFSAPPSPEPLSTHCMGLFLGFSAPRLRNLSRCTAWGYSSDSPRRVAGRLAGTAAGRPVGPCTWCGAEVRRRLAATPRFCSCTSLRRANPVEVQPFIVPRALSKHTGKTSPSTRPVRELPPAKPENAQTEHEAARLGGWVTDCRIRLSIGPETRIRRERNRSQRVEILDGTSRMRAARALPVQAIDTVLVMKVLEQEVDQSTGSLWNAKPETASRLRGRIESVLDWAKVRGYRDGENPARWRGHLSKLLPARSKVRKVEHHAALPYVELPSFMSELRSQEGVAARALEFAILTAARTGEVIGARWGEIDRSEKLWTVPPERMKAGKEHRVPLCARALVILDEVKTLSTVENEQADGFVFPGGKRRKPLSNMAILMLLRRMERADLTVHGFRSTFRDWAAERTNFPSEVAEMALAHTISNKVEQAYRRGDLFERRRRMMVAWEVFCFTLKEAPESKSPRSRVVGQFENSPR
jgi:integrase